MDIIGSYWTSIVGGERLCNNRCLYWIVLAVLIHHNPSNLYGQFLNTDGIYGQTGIVYTPVAALQADRKLTFGWQYIPAGQTHLKYSQKNDLGENVYYARLGFLPWAEASIRLVHPNKVKNGGYGIRGQILVDGKMALFW